MNDNVEIWWLEGAPTVDEVERMRWLLPAEVERVERYRHEGARERYITGRWMVRSLLSRQLGLASDALRFELGEHGKPSLTGQPLHFNLSHTDDMMVVALSESLEIGVDVEFIDRNTNLDQVARRSFSADEYAQFQVADDPREAFFAFWTHKEAYLKARGTGISLGLHRFGFVLAEDYSVADARLADVDDDPAKWTWWRHHHGQHRLALAAPSPTATVQLKAFTG